MTERNGTLRRSLVLCIVMVLLVSALTATVYADSACSISTAQNLESIEMTKGGSERLDLNTVFTDSKGHALTFTLDEASEELKARIDDNGSLRMDPLKNGSFQVKITATCTDDTSVSKQLTIPVNVNESEDEGDPRQYGYDESPADEVTVYLTMSNDGIPIVGRDSDNTAMAHLKVTVPYFDLALYGLENFYRYHTENGKGEYIDDEVVERPTSMHLFIYITERYYMGIPEDQCCEGTSGIMEYRDSSMIKDINGDDAYYASGRAYELSGIATSSYMEHLWGHSSNLMYYRNHVYPLMSNGWGSTADYQLLSDGDTIDVGLFSDPDFFGSGAFLCFDEEEYEAETGKTVGMMTMYASANAFSSSILKPISGVEISIYDEEWKKVGKSNSNSSAHTYKFNEPGTYYLIGHYNERSTASAAEVIVTDAFEDYPFISIKNDKGDVLSNFEVMDDLMYDEHFHVKVPEGTESVTIEWEELSPFEYKVCYWDYSSGSIVETQDDLNKEGNTVTLDPSEWMINDKAIVIVDSEHRSYGAFTFEPNMDEGYNFAPRRKYGVKEEIKKTLRELKDYEVKMTDLFFDPDGDELSYTVSVDGGAEESIDNNYVFHTGQPGSHTLVFTPYDSRGAVGQTHTQKLTIKENEIPEITDPSNNSAEVSIRYNEQAKFQINKVYTQNGKWISTEGVFTDLNNDDLVFCRSTNGGEFEEYTPYKYEAWWDTPDGIYHREYQSYIEYTPTGKDDIGNTYVFKLKAGDDLGTGEDIFTYTVHVVENQAPVPDEAELTEYCMLNHYWYLNPQTFFTDPEGDKIQSYMVSVNGSDPVYCDRTWHNDTFNNHRVLIDKDEKYVVQFFVTDSYGDVGTCTAEVYPTEEIIQDANLKDNVFSVGNGKDTFKASTTVTLRDVKYSEFDGDYNYYIDVDDYGTTEGDKLTLTRRGADSVSTGYGSSYSGAIDLALTNGVTNSGTFQVNGGDRFKVNMIESGDAVPEELILEPKYEELYVGELADRCIVKARFSDGVTRYISDYALSDTKFDTAGKHTLSATALGLTATAQIDVKSVPDNVAVINDMGKHGRLTLAEVVDVNNEPVTGALITVSDPVTDPKYDDSKYDGSYWGGIPDMLRDTYDVQVRVPMAYQEDQVRVRFRLYSDIDHSVEYLLDNGNHDSRIYSYADLGNVKNEEHIEYTDSYVLVDLTEGQGSHVAWWIDRSWGMRSWWHSYDLLDVHVKTGASEIIGKVSSWDEKDNAEFLAYPKDMSDEDIRADAKGEREHALSTSATVEKAEKNDGRYEQSFKVEGLDAGKYKLAVIKPGKYTVSVSEVEIDGTDDIGTVSMRLYGDINNDGRVRAGDATQICRYIAGNRSLTNDELLAADVNLDGKVRAGDATQICRYIASNNSAFDNLD